MPDLGNIRQRVEDIREKYAHYGNPKPNTAHSDIMALLGDVEALHQDRVRLLMDLAHLKGMTKAMERMINDKIQKEVKPDVS